MLFSDIIRSPSPLMNEKGEVQRYQVQKINEEKKLAFGWANISIRTDGNQVVDWQQNLIDTEVWEKVKDGTYSMFSIEGEAIREEVETE